MNSSRLLARSGALSSRSTALGRPSCGRTAVYGRSLQQTQQLHSHSSRTQSSRPLLSPCLIPLRSRFLPDGICPELGLASRKFHNGAKLAQEQTTQPTKDPRAEEAPEPETARKAAEESAESASGEENAKNESENSEGQKEEPKREAPLPPPPHGDKSPWQVFTETLQSEFKASKEWNESTKALAAGAQQFTENESVRRARQAYEQTTGAVTSTTANVLKTTAGAVGKGAAWTWETPVVKAARTTVNATASVIEKGTRPIRETEAYKNVKNVIDDGSSSKYGGWVEKEERRKARELREARQGAKLDRHGNRVEVMTENPE